MIRSVFTLLFWAATVPLAAIVLFPFTLLTGNIWPLYRAGIWLSRTGVRIAGIRVEAVGLERLDPQRTYLFLSNHASSLDPPLLMPLIPGRTSVLTKRELFRIPILGRAMRMASLVPVERSNREKAIASVQEACQVVRKGINMTIFVEGTRSHDGRLLKFKKGPFYIATETGVYIVPVTIVGTHELLPKGRLLGRPGVVRVTFHEPVDPKNSADRDELTSRVKSAIASALPPELVS